MTMQTACRGCPPSRRAGGALQRGAAVWACVRELRSKGETGFSAQPSRAGAIESRAVRSMYLALGRSAPNGLRRPSGRGVSRLSLGPTRCVLGRFGS